MEKNINNKKGETSSIVKIGICLALLLAVFLPIKEFLIGNSNKVLAYSKDECRYLSDTPYVAGQSSVGWGSITLDKNLDSKYNNGLITLLIDGQQKSFNKGVSAHATSTLVYDLSEYNYDYFNAYIGVDASRGNAGNGVKFYIYTSVDGTNWDLKTAETPQAMKGNTNAQLVNIDIKGAKYLKLHAHNNGNADGDHSVYADAMLIKEGFVFEEKELDFIKTVEEYDQMIKTHYGEEITGEYELTLLQRDFVKKAGYDYLVFIAQDDEVEETLRWLMTNVENIRMYLTGGAPAGTYSASMKVLNELYHTYKEDLNNKEVTKYGTVYGELYKKMMITLSLTHSAQVALWMQPSEPTNQSDAVTRYQIFKDMHKNEYFVVSPTIDIAEWFEKYNVEDMRFVMNNIIDDEEILWLNRYTKKQIDAHPNQVWTYLTPHPYMAYVWPNYGNSVFHDPANKEYWDEKFGGIFSEYGVTYSSDTNRKIYKVWMNFRNEFGTGAVCGGISKTGSNIRTVHGIPAAVIGQPGHAAIIYYNQNAEGKGYWSLDNDVSGWTLSEKGERMLIGWGNASWSRGYSVVYMALAQEALNDFENFEKCEKLVMLADVYNDDLTKKEEIYRKALEVQSINIDAWYGLITTFNANENKTENDYYDLAEELAENLKCFPLPMYHLTNLIKPKLTSVENSYRFTLLQTRILEEGKNLPNTSTEVLQPSLTRLEANYLLGNLDKTIATFSFDGEDAGKIVLSSRFDGVGVRWDYSLDGKQTWNEVSFTAEEEHKLQLTQEQLDSITSENDIYVHIVGVNYEEKNLYKIDILEQGLPVVYNNDWENKVMGVTDVMEWRWEDSNDWKLFREEEPDLTGDKTIVVRSGKTGVYLISPERTLTFTTDTDTPQRKYIPISHLSIHGVSTEATAQGRYARNAIDGNINTNWHSAWNGSDTQKYIIIKLDEPKYLTALDFFPVDGGNGKINNAVISVSMDGENWIEVVSGTNWPYNMNMKTVDFEATRAQYIKIVGKTTQNSFIAAAMFNLYEDSTIKTVAEFSFSGENAGKIVIEDGYKNTNWKYSLDGGENWKDANSDVYALSPEEIEQINEENQIKIRFEGDETEYNIKIKKGATPNRGYLNDWENRVIGLTDVETLEWKLVGDSNWISYEEQEPVVIGDKTLLIRAKATGIYTASDVVEYEFTAENYPETEVYIPISHLSIHAYSTQSKDPNRPFYAPNAIDGNINTMWHSTFDENIKENGEKAYLVIKLDETKYISALEFVHKKYTNLDPSFIKTGIVYVSEDGENWVEAGRLEDIPQEELVFRKIKFNESVQGQYVKFEMETYDMFASVLMINLYEDTTKQEKPEEPIFKSDKYIIEENLILRIAPGTTVQKFKENVETNQELIFTDKNGNTLNEDRKIATGTTIKVGEGKQYTLVVIGDTDGNGNITVTDLAQLKLHYIGKTILTDARLKAADMNGDGKITITDLAQIKLVLIGSLEIK